MSLRHVASLMSRHSAPAGTLSCRLLSSVEDRKAASFQNNLLVDTLQEVKRFESIGLTREQAEELTRHITELICMNKDRIDDKFVGKTALEKVILEQEAKLVGFKTELVKSQDVHWSTVNKDLERQNTFLDKMRSEVRHEIDKLTASQRLDLNLEKGRMRDDLQTLRDKATVLEIKLDKDVNELKATVEKAKNDNIKSVVALLGTFSAIAFTISRFVQMSH